MALALINVRSLICHKTQQTNQPTNLLSHVSLHYRKDSSQMPFSSIITALLRVSKCVLMISLSLDKRKSLQNNIRITLKLFKNSNILLRHELTDALAIDSMKMVQLKQIQFVPQQHSYFLVHKLKHAL